MRIATWNVNSIKQRLDNVLAWLKEREPDVACLQETKCVDKAFPREAIEALGYNVAVHGQKTFNGVAVVSKLRFDEVTARLPGDDEDDHARFLEVVVTSGARAVRIASIYLPNGNPPETDKYIYKLRWMDRLLHYADARLRLEEPLVLAGDYNVIPAPADVHDPAAWAGDALFLPHTRAKFRALLHLGLVEAVRATTDAEGIYTFWDYQAGAWQKNAGIPRLGKTVRPRARLDRTGFVKSGRLTAPAVRCGTARSIAPRGPAPRFYRSRSPASRRHCRGP